MWLTRPRRGFTCVRHVGLPLACGSGGPKLLDIAAPASHPAVTSDALGVGDRFEHEPEAVQPAHSLNATSCRTVDVPLIACLRTSTPKRIGILLPELARPTTDRLVPEHDASGSHQVFNVSKTQRESEGEPNGVSNDFGRVAVMLVRWGSSVHLHAQSIAQIPATSDAPRFM